MMTFKSDIAKKRTTNSLWILLLLVAGIFMFRYSADFMRFATGQREISDLGVEILQPSLVAMVYVLFGVVFSTLTAVFVEPQLREDAFGNYSRFGVSFVLCFLGYCVVAASIL